MKLSEALMRLEQQISISDLDALKLEVEESDMNEDDKTSFNEAWGMFRNLRGI